jgi:Rieske 2Fe-2S family protein
MAAAVNAGPAPVDLAALAEALRPFGASCTLPAHAYTDPDVFAWERRHFLAGAWTCLGRSDFLQAGEADGRSATGR